MTNNNSTINSKDEKTSIDIPNAETKEALAEYERMCLDKTEYKRYNSFAELLAVVLSEENK